MSRMSDTVETAIRSWLQDPGAASFSKTLQTTLRKGGCYRLIWTTFAGGMPLKFVEEAVV